MTKDNGEQFYAMACREYTLPRNDGSSHQEDGSREIPVACMVNTGFRLEFGL